MKDLQKAINGRNEDGTVKNVVTLGVQRQFLDPDKKPEVINQIVSLEPEVTIWTKNIGGHCDTYVKLSFNYSESEALAMYFQALNRYVDLATDINEPGYISAYLSLIPYQYDGEYFVEARYPRFFWDVPDVAGGDRNNLVICFDAANVVGFKSDTGRQYLETVLQMASQDSEDIYSYDDYDDCDEFFDEYDEEINTEFDEDRVQDLDIQDDNRFYADDDEE